MTTFQIVRVPSGEVIYTSDNPAQIADWLGITGTAEGYAVVQDGAAFRPIDGDHWHDTYHALFPVPVPADPLASVVAALEAEIAVDEALKPAMWLAAEHGNAVAVAAIAIKCGETAGLRRALALVLKQQGDAQS